MTDFKELLNQTIDAMIDVSYHHRCPGRLYEFATARMDTPEIKSVKRRIDYRAKKMNLMTSLFSVYGTSSDWTSMQELRIRIMDEFNIFVSPITWVPLEEYGKDFFIFAYFPLFERRQFNVTEYPGDLPPDSTELPVTADNMFRLETERLNIMNASGDVFQAPFVASRDYNDRAPALYCKRRPERFREFYEPDNDIAYGKELSSEEFARNVIKDMNMEDEHVPELKLIISHNPEKAARLYALLSSRLNTSWIINVNMYNSDKCAVTFSYDDSRLDQTSCHHSLFYIANNEIWGI